MASHVLRGHATKLYPRYPPAFRQRGFGLGPRGVERVGTIETSIPQPTDQDLPRFEEMRIFAVSTFLSKVLGQSEERIVDAICHEADVRL